MATHYAFGSAKSLSKLKTLNRQGSTPPPLLHPLIYNYLRMAIAPNPSATAALPRADRHRQQPSPVGSRRATRDPSTCRRRGIIMGARRPPWAGVGGRPRDESDPPVLPAHPRRPALGDSGAQLSPVDPLPLLQPAPDHALQLPHAAAQRFQLSLVTPLGLLPVGGVAGRLEGELRPGSTRPIGLVPSSMPHVHQS